MNSVAKLLKSLPKKHARIVSRVPVWQRIALLVLLFGLLVGSLYGVSYTNDMPDWVEEPLTMASYQHVGQFDYAVYTTPSHLYGNHVPIPEETGYSLYFTDIIDDIDVEFEYEFIADGPVTDVLSEIEVVAIVTGPSDWQKEVPISITSTSGLGKNLRVGFPLELEDFDELIDEIEKELEIRRADYTGPNTYTLVIEARVTTMGNASGKQIEANFTQPMQIKVGRGTLDWSNDLILSQRKSVGGFSYKQQGSFGYTLELEENSLYASGIDEITKEPYDWPPTFAVEPGGVYFNRIVDVMLASFDYHFSCNKPINKINEEIEVVAILEYPDVWTKTFTMVPKTRKSGKFRVDFAVDINSFGDFTDAVRGDIDLAPPKYDLTIMATVHTIAETEVGKIDEVFVYSLEGTLGPAVLTWSNKLENSKSGSIMGTHWVPNEEKFIGLSIDEAKIVFPVVAGIVFPFAIYLLLISIVFRPLGPSEVEKQAEQAKKKHKGLFVDVKEIPYVNDQTTTVIHLDSLDDLITAAENLFKPILHKAEDERHTYCVTDGAIRYEYLSESPLAQVNPYHDQDSQI